MHCLGRVIFALIVVSTVGRLFQGRRSVLTSRAQTVVVVEFSFYLQCYLLFFSVLLH